MIIPSDVIIFPYSTEERPNRWVAYNVFAKTSLGLSAQALSLLGDIQNSKDNAEIDVWETEWFANGEGTLADPSRFLRDISKWRHISCGLEEFVKICQKHCILVENEDEYRARFQMKTSVLDTNRFGNFHQQVGQHLLLQRRVHPSKWWLWQKFNEDVTEVRKDNLYGGVQYSYLQKYFANRMSKGTKVLDLGCGTGVYANLMASFGASVLGVDPSAEYLAIAKNNAVEGTEFRQANIGEAGSLTDLPSESFDVVFMSDALLFYFISVVPGEKPDIKVLLDDIRRLLKPNGIFISVEPHSVFYLNPWFGSENHPFTVLTEYAHPFYRTVPSFATLAQSIIRGGFVIQWMDELYPESSFEEVDARAYKFASEFPQWHLIEARKENR